MGVSGRASAVAARLAKLDEPLTRWINSDKPLIRRPSQQRDPLALRSPVIYALLAAAGAGFGSFAFFVIIGQLHELITVLFPPAAAIMSGTLNYRRAKALAHRRNHPPGP